MTFLVEITPIAEAQILKAYNWYRERNPEFADIWRARIDEHDCNVTRKTVTLRFSY